MNAPADRFKFSASTLATLAVVVAVAIGLSIASPWGVMVLMLLALAALFAVWFKAGIRTGRWLWVDPRAALNQVEGGVWLSAVVVLVPAIALMVFASLLANMAPSELPSISFGKVPIEDERGISYSNPDTQQRFRRALEAANIPHRAYERQGKEFIAWSRQHDEAVQKIDNLMWQSPLPSGRNVWFSEPTQQKRFTDWLSEQKISYEIVTSDGKPYVVWDETGGDALERYRQVQPMDCERKKTNKPERAAKKQGC
jgi:hypothetical protein